MKSTTSDPHRKVRPAPPRPAVRVVNLSRFALVVDPFRRSDPDELAPPCPVCRSATSTLWFVDRRTTRPTLVCLDCTPHQRTTEHPETDIPVGR